MIATKTLTGPRLLDGSAIGVSALCLVHCLALPLIALATPALSAWAEAAWVHVALVSVAAPVTALALFGQDRRPAGRVVALGAVGVLGLVAGALAHGPAEAVVTALASLALIAAHALNWRTRSQIRSTAPDRLD